MIVPPPIPADLLPSRNRMQDFATKVVRPSATDPNEMQVAGELRKRIVEYQSADSEFQRNSEVEFDFLSGKHWLDNIQNQDRAQELNNLGRSAFSIDLINPSIDIIINQIRINKPSMSFLPLADGADIATARIRTGLYRNIERESKADIARETAYQMAVSVGRGYYRILIEDDPGATFTRRLAFRRIDSLESVAIDPTCVDFCYADAEWAYFHDDVYKDAYELEYGRDDEDLDMSGQSLLDDKERVYWFPKDKVKVGEYYRRRWRKREVVQLEDKSVWWRDEAPTDRGAVIRVKQKMDDYLEYRKMSGTQTLEKRIWPGRLIPLVVVIGREVFRGKKPKIHSGMVRPAMDPSKINDYMTSRMVDEVALSPLPHMFAPEGSLAPEQKQIVNSINRHPWSLVTYTPQNDPEGRQLPGPQWASPSPNTAAVTQAAVSAKDSLMRVLNTFAPQLGSMQSGQSGTAISQVKDQGDVSHAAFPDNFNRAMTHEANIVNELMDFVYTEEQAITITEPDTKTLSVLINQWFRDKKTGKQTIHLFGGSKYGVVVTSSPSYPTRMAEASERILELVRVMPVEMAKVLDLVVRDLNIPNAEAYEDRLRPPGYKPDDELPDSQTLMQQINAQEQNLQQADNLIKQLLVKVQQLGSQEAIKRLEIASKERIAAANNASGIIESEIKAGQDATHAVLMATLQSILGELDREDDAQQEAQSVASGAEPAPQPNQPEPNPQILSQQTPSPGLQAPAPPAGQPAAPPVNAQ